MSHEASIAVQKSAFKSGLEKDFMFDAVKVAESTDVIYDMCVADTKANLVEIFKKARG